MIKGMPYGARVRIVGITHESDMDLNGRVGVLQRKFFSDRRFQVFGDIGVLLDEPSRGVRAINVCRSEVEVLPPPAP